MIPDYQIKLRPEGRWHRRGGIQHETACGERMDAVSGYHSRAFTLDDDLCEECFTRHERLLGIQTIERAKERSAEHSSEPGEVARPRTLTPKKIPKP